MENCLEDVRTWVLQNKLSLNDTKTEFLHFKIGVVMDSSLILSQNVDTFVNLLL